MEWNSQDKIQCNHQCVLTIPDQDTVAVLKGSISCSFTASDGGYQSKFYKDYIYNTIYLMFKQALYFLPTL